MVIFLYGPDDYRRAEKKKEIIAEFEKKRSALGLGFFNLEMPEEFPRLREFLRSGSLFEPAKLTVIESAFAIEPKLLAAALKPLTAEKNQTVLISEKEKPVKALAFLLEKPVLSQKFDALEGAEWITFIKAQAKKSGITLADSAAQFLGTVYAGNSWGAVTELAKLVSLDKKQIERNDLDAMGLEAAPNYWALLNGIKSFDIRNRLSALETLFAVNDPAPKIFNILASQWQEKMLLMAEYDFAVKSGKLEYEEVLVDLVL